ncbi:hypothetical protein ID866_2425 [Astraeus odoratus]|nr:hypothetical protein ID866_2425 [Astraeus odoratus]
MLGFLGSSRLSQTPNEAYEFLPSTYPEVTAGDAPSLTPVVDDSLSDGDIPLERSSSESTAMPTPSRAPSPSPSYPSHRFSSSISEADNGPNSPLLVGFGGARPTFRDGIRNLWNVNQNSRRRRKRERRIWRSIKKAARRVVRHPLFPRQPLTIIFALLLFTLFAISLTLLLMYILNPDKEPLPWQAYCSIPPTTTLPPNFRQALPYPYINPLPEEMPPAFPPDDLDTLPPAGIFLGVFSMDSALERRMLIRTTWATHPRSRDGIGAGDNGRGTSRTVVRFILGQPRKGWERRIQTEMETPRPAPHDSHFVWAQYSSGHPRPWGRPDYVVKVDDDAFVMLAELESRMRLELHAKGHNSYVSVNTYIPPSSAEAVVTESEPSYGADWEDGSIPKRDLSLSQDPLIYWGYLVKERFMAGELYGLSWNLVDWVSKDTVVQGFTQGAEDKQTAKWMTLHPQAGEIRWSVLAYIEAASRNYSGSPIQSAAPGLDIPTPSSWAHSSVSTFGTTYRSPLQDLTTAESVEALVEGSDMSRLREGTAADVRYAWRHREGELTRYQQKRVGGTVVVHFIKKHMWFLETALVLLENDDYSEFELENFPESARDTLGVRVSSVWMDSTVLAPKDTNSTL